MLSSSPRDNWERLVAAVVKRDQIWQLCHQDSITTASSYSHRSSFSSGEFLSNSSYPSPRQPPFTSISGAEDRKNVAGTITQKLFSALLRRRKPKDYDLGQGLVGIPEDHFGLQSFSLRELCTATDNFSNKNILGRGGRWSTVYKGRLADGSLVAVRRLQQQVMERLQKLESTKIVAHHNVLRARGFCITEMERLLVYPYMVNRNVEFWLKERDESLPPLDWPMRRRIALGAAKGLAYLHHECPRTIIHLDVKAANILLNEDFEAVVADSLWAELIDCYDGDVTSIRGTIGYIAPEFFVTYKCSVKVDVFSYGVFLLELLTGKRAFDRFRIANDDEAMLLNWVIGNFKDWKMMIDAELQGDLIYEEMEQLLQLALIGTRTDPEGRPTMLEVVRMLEDVLFLDEKWEECYTTVFEGKNMDRRNVDSFTLDKLEDATENFSNKIISIDGFNIVYEGRLADGSPVAVKRYNSRSLGYDFEKELEIGRICLHPNLVHVIGFCQTPEECLLVFRLMTNGSVESWLKGRHESRPPLTWRRRKMIALGVARGLAYLHDNCKKKIIHRDVKASNILLDGNFKAVIGDYKLGEFMDVNKTHGTTTVRGTIGHIAPEYLATGKCSDKADVFSYGAFLLELITGQRTIDLLDIVNDEDMMCVDWVKRNYEERNWKLMADKDTGGNFMEAVVKQLVKTSVLCTQYDPDKRPKMSEVVRMLEGGGGGGGAVEAGRSNERFEREVGEEEDDGIDSSSLESEEVSSPR